MASRGSTQHQLRMRWAAVVIGVVTVLLFGSVEVSADDDLQLVGLVHPASLPHKNSVPTTIPEGLSDAELKQHILQDAWKAAGAVQQGEDLSRLTRAIQEWKQNPLLDKEAPDLKALEAQRVQLLRQGMIQRQYPLLALQQQQQQQQQHQQQRLRQVEPPIQSTTKVTVMDS